jgi:hypothetical protein
VTRRNRRSKSGLLRAAVRQVRGYSLNAVARPVRQRSTFVTTPAARRRKRSFRRQFALHRRRGREHQRYHGASSRGVAGRADASLCASAPQSPRHWRRDGRRPQHKEYTRPLGRKSDPSFDMVMSRAGVVRLVEKKADTGAAVVCAPVCYVATAGPDHIVSASARPRWVASPAHATCPSGRTNTAFGAATGPIAGSSQGPA